jgi:acetyl-CoA C-acetyltransferase
MKEIVVLSAVRTPMGAFLGGLKDIPAPRLGAAVIREAVRRSGIPGDRIDECLMGSVLTGGMGQAPARQAALFGDLPTSVRCTTIGRVCGSGLKSVMLASQAIQCGDGDFIVAGGMESMSLAPYVLPRAREGYRMGDGKIVDSMVHDGLWDVYHNFHMGDAAELCAKERHISREEQDRFALQSYRRALDAWNRGLFKNEVVPIEITGREPFTVERDEGPFKAKLDKLGGLRPAFQKDGTITAGNATALTDGAAVLVITTQELARQMGSKPLARIVAQAGHAQAPEWFTTAPVGAIQKVLEKANLSIADIDIFELNEAFAVVALACLKELKVSEEKVNPRGGAVALGHPIGASGARILTTLIHTLRDEKKRFGVASLCIGGGEASALLVEALP